MLVAVCFDIYVQGRRERGGGGAWGMPTPPRPHHLLEQKFFSEKC